MLLDPEYGLPTTKATWSNAGLLLAYEKKTGYDTASTKRLPDCLDVWSAKRIKNKSADAVKFLLWRGQRWRTQPEKQATLDASVQSVWRYSFFHRNLGLRWKKIADAGSAGIRKSETTQGYWCYEESSQTHALTSDLESRSSSQRQIRWELWRWWNRAYSWRSGSFLQKRKTKQQIFHTSTWVRVYQQTLQEAASLPTNQVQTGKVLCGRATWAGSVEAYIKDGEAAAREWLHYNWIWEHWPDST